MFFPHYIVKHTKALHLLCIFCVCPQSDDEKIISTAIKKETASKLHFLPLSSHDFAWREKRKMIFCLCEEHGGIRPEHTSEFKMSIGYWFYDFSLLREERRKSLFSQTTQYAAAITRIFTIGPHTFFSALFLFKCLQALSCKQTVQTLV